MASSKYRTEILVHIYEWSYMIQLKIGNFKFICTLMHIILNHFQNSIFLLMKLFFTQDPEYSSRSIQILIETPLKHVFHAIALNSQNTHIMTNQILFHFFTEHSQNPFHNGFLAVETAMLQINSTVYENTLRKINSHAYITKAYHEGKPLPIGTFVLKRNFTHVHFSDKLKFFGLDHTKFLINCQM